MNQRIKKYLLVTLALLLLIPAQSFAINGYSDVVEETRSIFSLPAEGVKGQVSVGVKGNTYSNGTKNGDFSNGATDWFSVNGTTSANNNILTSIGSGGSATVQVYTTTNINSVSNKRVFIKALLKATNDSSINIRGRITGESGGTTVTAFEQLTPVNNQVYLLSGIITVGSDWVGNVRVFLQHAYSDSATASGKSMEIQEVLTVDMGTSSNDELYDLNIDELNDRFPYWFNGTKSTLPLSINGVGKNLIDTLQLERGTINEPGDKPNGVTNRVGMHVNLQIGKSYIISGLNDFKVYFRTDLTDNGWHGEGYVYTANSVLTAVIFRKSDNSEFDVSELKGLNIQLEEGASATTYEVYKESISYITLPEGEELRSLPNGVKDEVSGGKLYKRTGKHVLQSGDITSLQTSATNYDTVAIVQGNFSPSVVAIDSSNSPGIFRIPGFRNASISITDDDSLVWTYAYDTDFSGALRLLIPKGTYVDLAAAQADLAGTTLTYQLAQPKEQTLITTPLIGYPNGTIIIEPVVKSAAMYKDGITIEDSSLPIKHIESVNKIQKGIKTPVNFTKIDEYSFTIEGAVNGEIYEYVYKYPSELTTIPTISYSVPTTLQGQVNGNVKITEINTQTIQEIQNRIDLLRQQLGNVINIP